MSNKKPITQIKLEGAFCNDSSESDTSSESSEEQPKKRIHF